MIEIGLLVSLAIGGIVGWIIVQSFIAHRHWRRVIAAGDEDAMHAALLEALDTWRTMRPPYDVQPADWRALQSAGVVAADSTRCRVSILAEPDIRVLDGVRGEVGPPIEVARRAAVRMCERLLYEIPLIRFDAVQVDAYTEYRSPGGATDSECLMTTQLTREEARNADWDEASAEQLLASWRTREAHPGEPLDPDVDALIVASPAPESEAQPAASGGPA